MHRELKKNPEVFEKQQGLIIKEHKRERLWEIEKEKENVRDRKGEIRKRKR